MKKKISKAATKQVYIGTSGWVYKSWHNILYPKNVKKDFLEHYSKFYNSVEVNSSFYHLPKKTTFSKWKKETPDEFAFSVKLSRYITHIKRLKGVKRALIRFLTAAQGMRPKLKIILIQLPPLLAYDKSTLAKFVKDFEDARKKLKFQVRAALEPRHYSWFTDKNLNDIREILHKSNIAMVFAHSSVFPNYDPRDSANNTSDCIYVRFHGPREFASSKYGKKRLSPWAKMIKEWSKDKTVFAYFNDDAHGYAVKDASDLMKLTK